MASTPASQALVILPPVRRRVFWTLGLGAFGLAFSLTTTAAYLPPLLRRFTDSGGLIGVILGAEAVTVSAGLGADDDGLRAGDPARTRGRRARAGLRGLLGVRAAELAHLLVGRRRAAVSARELGVGGHVCGGPDVRRPLRDPRAA